MELLNIRTYPDIILKKKAKLVTDINSIVQKLIGNMAHTMYKAQGVGLAAPQIGIENRIIVYDIKRGGKNSFTAIINPKIIDKNKKIISENEGCLSVPGFRANVKRFDEIMVEGIDVDKKPLLIKASGTLSIVLQHEIDHLDGILFIDRISSLKRLIYKKRVLKHMRSRGR